MTGLDLAPRFPRRKLHAMPSTVTIMSDKSDMAE